MDRIQGHATNSWCWVRTGKRSPPMQNIQCRRSACSCGRLRQSWDAKSAQRSGKSYKLKSRISGRSKLNQIRFEYCHAIGKATKIPIDCRGYFVVGRPAAFQALKPPDMLRAFL